MAVTINDIARLAQVDKSTVSMTLRNHPNARNLRAETRERIRRIAAELGYRSNAGAVAIRTGKVSVIALIADAAASGRLLLSMNLTGILQEASRFNYGIKIYSDADLDDVFGEINSNRIDFVLSMSVDHAKREITANHARRLGLHLVFLYEHPHEEFPCVNLDNVRAGEIAVEHLASLGHRRIALACSTHLFFYQKERHQGFLSGMRHAGLTVDPELICCGGDDSEDRIRRVLSLPAEQRPTAFFCIADGLAMQVQRIAVRLGLNLPDELSVVGLGNSEACRDVFVPLTSIDENFEERGHLAVDLVLGKLPDAQRLEDGYYLTVPRLIVRESTCRIKPE